MNLRGTALTREAGPADAPALLRLMREYYAEDGYAFDEAQALAALDRLLREPALGRVWLLLDGVDAIGYAVLTFGYSLEYRGRDAFVDELYIRPSHRGRGLGRRALATLEQACHEAGVRALHLEVEHDKPGAIGLYRSSGFDDQRRYLLTKRLDAETP